MESRSRGAQALVLLGLLAAGCRSAEPEPVKTEPFVPLPDEDPASIGFFLTQLDKSLQRWSDLKLTASDAKDERTLQALEKNLELDTRKRQDELVAVLEAGPPTNRQIAAAALGFTHDPAVLSPLLSALSDRDPALVQKALLGLGILALPETPLAQLLHIMLRDSDPWTRNNAAFALQCITSTGGRSMDLAAAALSGLADSEPGVRAQCASILGILEEPEAVEPLANLVYDDVSLVSAAAVTALARIGRFQQQKKGQAARALADALDELEDGRRTQVLRGLMALSDQNLGEDATVWREWAYRLP